MYHVVRCRICLLSVCAQVAQECKQKGAAEVDTYAVDLSDSASIVDLGKKLQVPTQPDIWPRRLHCNECCRSAAYVQPSVISAQSYGVAAQPLHCALRSHALLMQSKYESVDVLVNAAGTWTPKEVWRLDQGH